MPFLIDVDPYNQVIERIRKGEIKEMPFVRLAESGYEVPQTFALRYQPVSDEPAWSMVFEVNRRGVPRCVAVTVEATKRGREIRTGDLRLSVERSLEHATRQVAARREINAEGMSRPIAGAVADVYSGATLRAVRAARRQTPRKVTDQVLQTVAEVYRQNVEDSPTEAVAAHLGVADRTARLYVKRAREAGFLGAAIRGKAGEQ